MLCEGSFLNHHNRCDALLSSINDGVIVVAKDGHILFYNTAALNIFDFSNMSDIFQDASLYFEPIRLAVEGKETKDLEIFISSFKLPDGAYFHLSAKPLVDEKGAIYGGMCVFRDITRYKLLEQMQSAGSAIVKTLAEADTLHDACSGILQALCEGLRCDFGEIWIVDTANNILRYVGNWHMPSCQLLELTKISGQFTFSCGEELPGRIWAGGKPLWIQDIVHDGKISRTPMAVKDGFRSAFGFPIQAAGEVIGVIDFFSKSMSEPDQDIQHMLEVMGNQIGQFMKRWHVEESLAMAKEQAEQASRAKSEFLSRMSHELRTPMNSILGFAQLLMTDTEEPLTLSQHENVEQILQAGQHLLGLINEILDSARIEAGKVTLFMGNTAIGPLLQEVFSVVRPMIQQRGLTLHDLTEDFFEYTVWADRNRLKQILLNLLSNAIKYNQEGGIVTVKCELIGQATVRFSVIDTGIGIEEEDQLFLFQPFNRLGAEGSGVEGTGMGLSISKRLVELMGGSVGVKSNIGDGSSFYFDLMAGKEEENKEIRETELQVTSYNSTFPDISKGCRNILYIEDNSANLRLVNGILKRRPAVKLLTAENGQLGIALAKGEIPDLIVVDINLPDMNGFELLQKLQEDKDTCKIPVIALSANAMPKDIEKALAAGFQKYITKPIHVKKFLEIIDELLCLSG